MIDLTNAVNKKTIPENKSPDKVIDLIEQILEFNKQQKGKGFKLLTPKINTSKIVSRSWKSEKVIIHLKFY